jgi:hypothetical protein
VTAYDADGEYIQWLTSELAYARGQLVKARAERDEALAMCQRYESAATETSEALKVAGLPPTIPSSVKVLVAERDEARATTERLHATVATTSRNHQSAVAEAERRGRAAERADVVAYLRKSAADLRSLGAFDSDQAVEDECDDIEAGRHVGAAGKGEA